MPRNFFNLPAPWDPGYADYDPAEAEGLERRAITTYQMPRGTYDEPTVGPAGYAVPKYVMSEGYGQGAAITKMLPRGFVDANPHWLDKPTSTWVPEGKTTDAMEWRVATATSGLGAYDTGEATHYNYRGADPYAAFGQRAASAVAARLGRVAPARRQHALKLVLDKVDPTLWGRAQQETKRSGGDPMAGLARAMAAGLRKEVIDMGSARKAPRVNSHLGLAAYGHLPALGDVLEELGAWHPLSTVTGGASSAAPAPKAGVAELVEVGPFRFPVDGGAIVDAKGTQLNATWQAFVTDAIKRWNRMIGQNVYGGSMPRAAGDFGLDKWIGMPGGYAINPDTVTGRAPVITAKHPKTGEKWAVFITANKDAIRFQWKKMPSDWLGDVFAWIASLPAKLVGVAKDVASFAGGVLSDIAHAACNALASPGAGAAAASAGGPAGAAGAAAAASICGGQNTQPLPPVQTSPPISMTTLLLLGGAAVGGYFLLSKKKKAG